MNEDQVTQTDEISQDPVEETPETPDLEVVEGGEPANDPAPDDSEEEPGFDPEEEEEANDPEPEDQVAESEVPESIAVARQGLMSDDPVAMQEAFDLASELFERVFGVTLDDLFLHHYGEDRPKLDVSKIKANSQLEKKVAELDARLAKKEQKEKLESAITKSGPQIVKYYVDRGAPMTLEDVRVAYLHNPQGKILDSLKVANPDRWRELVNAIESKKPTSSPEGVKVPSTERGGVRSMTRQEAMKNPAAYLAEIN